MEPLKPLLLISFVITGLLVTARAEADSTITRYASELNIDGSYSFDIAQSNGAEHREDGVGGQYAQGYFRHYSPEGKFVQIIYVADENGYQPQSDALPTPPPVPAHIQRAIEYIRAHPTPEELADQQVRARQF
ncbi:larval cuticle protein 4 [Bactrocera tryoni]|uniref:larval cuticle protein 4 n=1 Tax=Bactrocera tryoni TaxID=59916 RepID=UPI001A99E80E|nr:larval cuticle protein 4 [Bactrocera tryoni]